jgi:translation initiation factor eIF-2B subunit epsilon
MSQKNPKNAPGGGKGAPKGKKRAAAGKKAEDEREETLQAVV